jgi:hypothetical protein
MTECILDCYLVFFNGGTVPLFWRTKHIQIVKLIHFIMVIKVKKNYEY